MSTVLYLTVQSLVDLPVMSPAPVPAPFHSYLPPIIVKQHSRIFSTVQVYTRPNRSGTRSLYS